MKGLGRNEFALRTWFSLIGAAWPIFLAIDDLTRELLMTPAQISLLNVLLDSFPQSITPVAVAKKLKVTPGTVTGTLNRLEEGGFIERSHGENKDRRIVNLRITRKGKEIVERWRQSCQDHIVEAMTHFSDKELGTLITLLSRLGPPITGVPDRLASLVKSNPNTTRRRPMKEK